MRHVKLSFLLFSAITRQCSALTAGAGAVASSNRIFIGGLSNQCTDQLLEESFAPFGTVVDISIVGLDTDGDGETKKRKPFAFITFDSTQSAVNAISINNSCDQIQNRCDQDLFQQVKRAEPIDRTKRKRSNASRTKEENHRDHILRICEQTNLLLQVQSTHADRLADYIQVIKSEHQHHDLEFKMEGLTNAVTKNMSLLFLSVSDPAELARRLSLDPILFRAVKKYYVVEKGALETNLSQDSGCEMVVRHALGKMSMSTIETIDCSFRVHAFPPSNQSRILSAIERINTSTTENKIQQSIKLDPRDFTNILSVVEVYNYDGRGKEVIEDGLAMSGVSPSFVSNLEDNKDTTDDNAVNRAYYKLKEAMGRYLREHQDFDSSAFQDTIALDCGSSPGGWSKFLADDMKCKLVYSVDPGDLVIDLGNVHHMKMKIQDAIPILKELKTKINVFVSDMCLHEMEEQLNFLLLAKDDDILEDNAFFVLTLKCNSGFSKANFDGQLEKVLETLASRAKTRKISTYHLFSNRNGERTIMGFIL